MHLAPPLQLAYCTNIHRGQSWPETLDALNRFVLAVRQRVAPAQPYAIGLRLSAEAATQLSDPSTLLEFQRWLERHHCYVFTVNGFPYGRFHGTRVKEQVYAPDWTTPERLAYTNLLFDLLAQLVPDSMEGSVSTVPGSFKEFIHSPAQVQAMQDNLHLCAQHIDQLSARRAHPLHLGLEPEPLCFLETTAETVRFFDELRTRHCHDPRLDRHLGVNYDACHLAVEYEDPREAIARLLDAQIKISKFHLSSALRVRPTPQTRAALGAFADDVYLHQVIERAPDGTLTRYRDLDVALQEANAQPEAASREWRIHFHIPLHSEPTALFNNTTDHLLGVLDVLQAQPGICSHLEMETYTWEVMPAPLKNRDVVDQLAAEYAWTLRQLGQRGLGPP